MKRTDIKPGEDYGYRTSKHLPLGRVTVRDTRLYVSTVSRFQGRAREGDLRDITLPGGETIRAPYLLAERGKPGGVLVRHHLDYLGGRVGLAQPRRIVGPWAEAKAADDAARAEREAADAAERERRQEMSRREDAARDRLTSLLGREASLWLDRTTGRCEVGMDDLEALLDIAEKGQAR